MKMICRNYLKLVLTKYKMHNNKIRKDLIRANDQDKSRRKRFINIKNTNTRKSKRNKKSRRKNPNIVKNTMY